MTKRRHHRRHARKNPSTNTWLIIGGAAALAGLYFFWPKKAAAATPATPVAPVIPSQCQNQAVLFSSYQKLWMAAQAACKADPNSKACSDVNVLASQVNAIWEKWPAECGPKPGLISG